ncbi:MAG TPA: hypothetical protein ENH49_00400 [Candidatus Marinimicrobia bacterium]|nr:hypothetical protein [Candidatus Neomarinimicrobiota bacterium]
MSSMKLYFDVRDIFRAPRLALSGKKILVFTQALLVGYVAYLILTYISFGLAGYSFSEAWSRYGLYPCLYGNPGPWYAYLIYWIGTIILLLAINFGCTAVSRITYKQLKGDEFFSSGDAWKYVKKHWHPVVFTSISFLFILIFFFALAAFFGLLGKIPYVGEFLFVIPYLLYFFGAIFTIYTAIVFGVSFLYTPSIISAYEEDTMGTVFNSYSITWSQPWRIILYHLVLLPIAALALHIFIWFWQAGYHLINYFFGYNWLMGSKLANIVAYASNIVCPESLHRLVSSICSVGNHAVFFTGNVFSRCDITPNVDLASLSGTETAAGVILAVFLFLLILSATAYVLSIFSVGETLMFVIFKKKSDDDNILERKDEDELEEEDEDDSDFSFDETEENDNADSDEKTETDDTDDKPDSPDEEE